VSILASMTYNGTNVVVTNTGSAFLPKTPEIFNHDSDGSLTNDGRWAYTWDAENRLIGMETDTNKVGAAGVPHQKLIFQYDAQSRRISKVVSNFNGSTWSEVSNLRFIWDGWNLLAELDKTNAVVRSYAWGLDLSGTEQGAGGIGGLLWVNLPQASNTQARGSHFVAFDGNGNVAALLNAQTAQTSAEYEYGPFGETIRATGPAVSVNPFQFSTKYRDAETGLLYYGYRYYRPGTGSWLSQDPLEEIGSRNLYQYVANNPIVLTDYLGMLELQVWQRIKNGLISGGSGAATGAGTGALVGAGVGAIGGLGAGAAPGAGAGAILGGIGGGIGGFINGVLRDPNTTTGVLVTQGAIGGVVGGITGGVGGGLSGTTGLLVPSLSSGIAGTSAGGAASATLGTTLSTTTLSTVNSVGITTAAATIASSAGGNGKCCFQWVGARGPDPQGYGARLDGGVNRNLKVTTPENFSRHFDAAQPGYPSTSPTLLIEAKTGHQWAADPNAPSNWLATRAIQFSMQAYIASRCGCQYKIYVNNPVGAQGLKQHLPMFPVEYYP
jgi:RHS repeat-associated protein